MSPEELLRMAALLLALDADRGPARRTGPPAAVAESIAIDPELRARVIGKLMLGEGRATSCDPNDPMEIRNPWPPDSDPSRVVYQAKPAPGHAGTIDLELKVDQVKSGDQILIRNPLLIQGNGMMVTPETIDEKLGIVRASVTLPKPGRYDVYVGREKDCKERPRDDYGVLKGWLVLE